MPKQKRQYISHAAQPMLRPTLQHQQYYLTKMARWSPYRNFLGQIDRPIRKFTVYEVCSNYYSLCLSKLPMVCSVIIF